MMEELTFQFPLETITVSLSDDERMSYRQLIMWSALYRYWYYVLHQSKVTDTEYDEVETLIREMEGECEYLRNPYSPVSGKHAVGSTRTVDYPNFIRYLFFNAKLTSVF